MRQEDITEALDHLRASVVCDLAAVLRREGFEIRVGWAAFVGDVGGKRAASHGNGLPVVTEK